MVKMKHISSFFPLKFGDLIYGKTQAKGIGMYKFNGNVGADWEVKAENRVLNLPRYRGVEQLSYLLFCENRLSTRLEV